MSCEMHNDCPCDGCPNPKRPCKFFVIPFFIALTILTVVAFIIPLRPTQSMNEKRNLAQFPAFTVDALISGDYFDDITLWFSDTYPGRDSWISLSMAVEEYHGIQDVVIYGDFDEQDEIPDSYVAPTEETEPTEATEATQAPESEPATEAAEETEPPETTPPETPVEQWGGVNAGEDAEVYLGKVIQIGDTVFNYFGFSQYQSDRFITTMTRFQDAVADREGLRIVTTLIPTSVGVLVEPEYQEKIGCVDQGQVIDYLFSGIPDTIVEVDIFDTLVEHNDEYIYFRTDHHWTALGGYYCYRDICEALGMEATPLESFEELDMGEFQGSNFYKCNQSSKLTLDNVYAYQPAGNITMKINNDNGRFEWPVITDMSKSSKTSKYMAFLAGDHALCEITNHDLPDAGNCVIIKDSYGNCVAPFFTQNYHNVYVIDFRKYTEMNLQKFIDKYEIDDVIFLVQAAAAQSESYNDLIRSICGVKQ